MARNASDLDMFERTAGWLQLGINIYIHTDRYVGNEGIYIVVTL